MTYLISIQSITYFAYLYADLQNYSIKYINTKKYKHIDVYLTIYIIIKFQKIFLKVYILYAVFC